MSCSRRPSTSQRRKPASSIASTTARSRCVRSAHTSCSTSPGERILGSVPGPAHQPHPTPATLPGPPTRQPARHRIAINASIAANHQILEQARNARQPPSDRPRRQPALPVLDPHHVLVPGRALPAQKRETSADVTSAGSLPPITSKNTFKSYAVASHVFTAPRTPTNSRYPSTSGCPSVIARNSDPSNTRSTQGTKLTAALLPRRRQDGAEPSCPRRTARTR